MLKRLFLVLCAALVLASCTRNDFRSRPTFDGKVYYALNEKNEIVRFDDEEAVEIKTATLDSFPAPASVNFWPLYYYRNPIFTVLWPLFERGDIMTIVRGFYRHNALDNNTLYTALFLGGYYTAPERSDAWLFPLFYRNNNFTDTKRSWLFLGGLAGDCVQNYENVPSGDEPNPGIEHTSHFFPVWFYGHDNQHTFIATLLGLCGYENNCYSTYAHTDAWFFPLYDIDWHRDASDSAEAAHLQHLWTPLFAYNHFAYALSGVYGEVGSGLSWFFPLFCAYQDPDTEGLEMLITPLFGWYSDVEKNMAYYLTPLFCRTNRICGTNTVRRYHLPWPLLKIQRYDPEPEGNGGTCSVSIPLLVDIKNDCPEQSVHYSFDSGYYCYYSYHLTNALRILNFGYSHTLEDQPGHREDTQYYYGLYMTGETRDQSDRKLAMNAPCADSSYNAHKTFFPLYRFSEEQTVRTDFCNTQIDTPQKGDYTIIQTTKKEHTLYPLLTDYSYRERCRTDSAGCCDCHTDQEFNFLQPFVFNMKKNTIAFDGGTTYNKFELNALLALFQFEKNRREFIQGYPCTKIDINLLWTLLGTYRHEKEIMLLEDKSTSYQQDYSLTFLCSLFGYKQTNYSHQLWLTPLYFYNYDKQPQATTRSHHSYFNLLYDVTRTHNDQGEALSGRTRFLYKVFDSSYDQTHYSMEMFPFIQYNSDAEKESKHFSFAWRLFRYESDAASTKLDVLFIPLMR